MSGSFFSLFSRASSYPRADLLVSVQIPILVVEDSWREVLPRKVEEIRHKRFISFLLLSLLLSLASWTKLTLHYLVFVTFLSAQARGNQSLRPITIKQFLSASQPHPDADFIIDDVDVNQVSIHRFSFALCMDTVTLEVAGELEGEADLEGRRARWKEGRTRRSSAFPSFFSARSSPLFPLLSLSSGHRRRHRSKSRQPSYQRFNHSRRRNRTV